MRAIILGGAGQIGSVIRERLGRHHEIISTSRKASAGHVRFDPFRDDWSVLGNADVLINCVGSIEASRAQTFDKVHIEVTRQIIDNRHAIGNPRIVQISALGASPRHRSDFLRTKGLADDLLLQHPDTVVIRPSIVCTHRTMLVRKMLMLSQMAKYSRGLVIVPAGFLSTRIQPVMPDDLARIVKASCTSRDHRIVDVAGPEVLTFGDVLSILSEERRQKFRLFEVPRRVLDLMVGRIVSRLLPAVINDQQYALLFQDNVADNRICTELLGTPMMPVTNFFRKEFTHATR